MQVASPLVQTADSIFMVRPAFFGFNPETGATNSFQTLQRNDLTVAALSEFDRAVSALQAAGVRVVVFDSADDGAPDAIFPNNWFTLLHDGTLILYPMQPVSRRRERSVEAVAFLERNFLPVSLLDLTGYEERGLFLEGTGSMVFDHRRKIAYAAESNRTHRSVLEDLCGRIGYTPYLFRAVDAAGSPVYHTNVVMNIASGYAMLCAETISDSLERDRLINDLRQSGRELLLLTMEQMQLFCGNILQVRDAAGRELTVCSSTAYEAFLPAQRQLISPLLVVDVPLIEQAGGGGIRCMMAEIFYTTSNT